MRLHGGSNLRLALTPRKTLRFMHWKIQTGRLFPPMTEPILRVAPAQADESRLAYPGWKIVLAGFFGVMVSFAAIVPYTFGLFIKPLAESFGWNREATSAGFSIAALTVAAASPGLGFLLDRYKPRLIILPCIAVFSVAYASLALLTAHLVHFYLTFFVIGLVGNGTAYIGFPSHLHVVQLPPWLCSFHHACGQCIGRHGPSSRYPGHHYASWMARRLRQPGVTCLCCRLPPNCSVRPRTARRTSRPARLHGTWRAGCQGACHTSFLDHCRHGLPLRHKRQWSHRASLSAAHRPRCFAGWRSLVRLYHRSHKFDRAASYRHVSRPLLRSAGFAGHAADDGSRHCAAILADSLVAGLIAASLIGFSMGSEGDITPYLLGRYFGLKRFSTLYALTWTTYAIGGATGPVLVGRVFDTLGSYRPITIQLLALPALIPCLLMFALPRYRIQTGGDQQIDIPPNPEPAEIAP